MPIQAQCPHCQKVYRLKDEAAGKKALCQNPECRKPFVVDALPERPKPKPKVARRDTEAMAAAAFSEPGEVIPEDLRSIPLTCSTCDHKWEVPWAMQGKNVLCPECRTRQKVPEQKKAKASDWRDTSSKPSMARVEQLEGVVASTEARGVSGSSLVQSGVVKEEIEPRPKWHLAVFIGVPIVMIATIVFGIMYVMKTAGEDKQEKFMVDALKDMQETTDSPMPAPEAALCRAILYISAGEYAARQEKPEQTKEAISHFERARQELLATTSSAARDFLFGELAVAQVNLGGDSEQVLGQKKIRWTPQDAGAGRAGRGNAEGKIYFVQEEIRSTLAKMQTQQCPKEARLFAIRRVAFELAKRGQTELITDSILGQSFPDAAEKAEATALVAIETHRANPEKNPLTVPPGKLTTIIQFYYDIADSPPDAVTKVKTSDGLETRIRNLILVAEWSKDPKEAVAAALAVIEADSKRESNSSVDLTLIRLAAQAGRADQADKAKTIAEKAAKPETKAWANAESLRNRLPVGYKDKLAEELLVEVPTDPKEYRSGHAWGRLAFARHNAAATGDQSKLIVAMYDRWGKGTFRPFGLAGLALGLQDREKR